MILPIRKMGLLHWRVLSLQHLQNGSSRFGAGILWLKDASTIAVGNPANSLPEATRQHERVILPCELVLVRRRSPSGGVEQGVLEFLHQGFAVAFGPQVHPLGQEGPDGLRSFHSVLSLQDDSTEDDELLRVVFAFANTTEKPSQGGHEPFPDPSSGWFVRPQWQLHDALPEVLEDRVGGDTAV